MADADILLEVLARPLRAGDHPALDFGEFGKNRLEIFAIVANPPITFGLDLAFLHFTGAEAEDVGFAGVQPDGGVRRAHMPLPRSSAP